MAHRLHYVLEGPADAPVVVFINSLGADLSTWDAQVPALTQHFRVLRYDQLGHGASEVREGPYSMHMLGEDLVHLLDALQIERAHVVGISLGGMLAMWLAIHHPERVDHLVPMCTAPSFGAAAGWYERANSARHHGLDEIADAAAGRWLTPSYAAAHPDVRRRLVEMVRSTPVEGYAGCCEAIAGTDLWDRIEQIAAPTLTIAGEFDAGSPPETLQRIADAIPGAHAIVIPDAAHLANIEQPDAVTSALLAFLPH